MRRNREVLHKKCALPVASCDFNDTRGSVFRQRDEICVVGWQHLGVARVDRREAGGRILVRATMVGAPFSSSTDTRASPTPSPWMASAVSKAGLTRKLCEAAFSPFCSEGV